MTNEKTIWEAEVYDIFQIEIEIDGVKKIIKARAGKWNLYYDYTGDSDAQLRRAKSRPLRP